jgi:hypothetical protein
MFGGNLGERLGEEFSERLNEVFVRDQVRG